MKVDIPIAALSDRTACSQFIESCKTRQGLSTPRDAVQPAQTLIPTERQIDFANRLMSEQNLGPIPQSALQSREAMSAHIQSLLDRKQKPGQGPTSLEEIDKNSPTSI
jgi:septation ring formation regulator EzrA